MTRTYSAKKADITRKWYVVDANGKTLGHLASQVAIVLRGKHKPVFTPHVDTGDHVIVVNAENEDVLSPFGLPRRVEGGNRQGGLEPQAGRGSRTGH